MRLSIYLAWAAIGLVVGRTNNNAAYFWLFVALLYPAGILATTVHEFGHATATWLVGGRVYSITIGAGRSIFRFRVGEFDLEFASNPFLGGCIFPFPGAGPPRKWKRAVILVGGVVAEAIVGACVFLLLAKLDDAGSAAEGRFTQTLLKMMMLALAACLTLSAVINLWPMTIRRNRRILSSDGKQLLGLLGDRNFYDRAAYSRAIFTGLALLRDGRQEDARTHFESAWADLARSELFAGLVHATGKVVGPRAAAQLYFDHLERMPPPGSFGMEWSNAMGNVAWHALLTGQPEWFGLADQLSTRAYTLSPHGPIKATRGAVLVAKGHRRAGELIMRAALSECAVQDQAEFCDFLARSKIADGDAVLGAEYARLSKHLARAA